MTRVNVSRMFGENPYATCMEDDDKSNGHASSISDGDCEEHLEAHIKLTGMTAESGAVVVESKLCDVTADSKPGASLRMREPAFPQSRVDQAILEEAARIVRVSAIAAAAFPGKYTLGHTIASSATQDKVEFTCATKEVGNEITVTGLVASSGDPGTVHDVKVGVSSEYIRGFCPCKGCDTAQMRLAKKIGKHAVAFLLVLSQETEFKPCKSLSLIERPMAIANDGADGETKSAVDIYNVDGRSKRLVLAGGPRHIYTSDNLSTTINVPVDIKSFKAIFDFASGTFAELKANVVAQCTREIVEIYGQQGDQCIPVFRQRPYMRKSGTRVRFALGATDVRRDWCCKFTDCPMAGSVGWNYGGHEHDKVIVTFIVNGADCHHYERETAHGFGEVRGNRRQELLSQLKDAVTTGKDARGGGPTALYNSSVGVSEDRAMRGAPISKSVVKNIVAEKKKQNSLILAADVFESLNKLAVINMKMSPDSRFVQEVSVTGENLKVVTFSDRAIEACKDSAATLGQCFIDATGKVVSDINIVDREGTTKAMPVLTTTLSVPVPKSGSEHSKPLPVMREYSIKTPGSNTAMSLILFKQRWVQLFGKPPRFKYYGLDCGISLLNGVLLAFNETKLTDYALHMMTRIQQGLTAEQAADEKGWGIVTWCLWHCNDAVRNRCKEHLKATELLTKAERSDIVFALYESVRDADTLAKQNFSIKSTQSLLGEPLLGTCLHLPSIVLCADVVVFEVNTTKAMVRLDKKWFDADGNLLASCLNPFYDPDSLQYMNRQWLKESHLVLWTALYISGAFRRHNGSAEVSNNQMKNFEHEGTVNIGSRVDEFIQKDQKVHFDLVARYFDELQKRIASGGVSMPEALAAAKTNRNEKPSAADFEQNEEWQPKRKIVISNDTAEEADVLKSPLRLTPPLDSA